MESFLRKDDVKEAQAEECPKSVCFFVYELFGHQPGKHMRMFWMFPNGDRVEQEVTVILDAGSGVVENVVYFARGDG